MGLAATGVFAASLSLYAAYHTNNRGMTLLLLMVAALIVVSGTIGGSTVYRTLFYLPNFTAGVATMLLWKKLLGIPLDLSDLFDIDSVGSLLTAVFCLLM